MAQLSQQKYGRNIFAPKSTGMLSDDPKWKTGEVIKKFPRPLIGFKVIEKTHNGYNLGKIENGALRTVNYIPGNPLRSIPVKPEWYKLFPDIEKSKQSEEEEG